MAGHDQRRALVTLAGQDETERLAAALARAAQAGDCLLLSGDLGAGKSTFARAFIRTLTSPDEDVPSPTFTLVQQYILPPGGPATEIWHADLYRLADADEVLELGLDEAFAREICLVEWPDRLGRLRPKGALDLAFAFADGDAANRRRVEISAPGGWAERLETIVKDAQLTMEWLA